MTNVGYQVIHCVFVSILNFLITGKELCHINVPKSNRINDIAIHEEHQDYSLNWKVDDSSILLNEEVIFGESLHREE